MKKILLFLLLTGFRADCTPPPGYTLVFQSDFNNTSLDVGAGLGVPVVPNWGSLPTYQLGAGWVPQFLGVQPNGKRLLDAYITQPQDPSGQPYPVWQGWGQLVITPYWDTAQSHWRSAMLSTVDTTGHGFAQALGYFEVSCTVQNYPGAWIAPIWLKGLEDIPYLGPQTKNVSEIDIELYGHAPAVAQAAVHDWTPSGPDMSNQIYQMPMPSGTWSGTTTESFQSGSHTFGILVTKTAITFLIDGVQAWTTQSVPASALEPLYALSDIEMGGGYTDAPAGTVIPPMWLQDLRVYAPPATFPATKWETRVNTEVSTTDPNPAQLLQWINGNPPPRQGWQ